MTETKATTEDITEIQKRSNAVLVILAAIAFAFLAYAAYSEAFITAGFDTRPDLADGGEVTHVALPNGKTADELVGLGVDDTNTGYFWWSDGTVTQGTGRAAADIADSESFEVPFGKRVSDIVGMAVNRIGNVYTYYCDFTVSIGDPFDLDSVDRPRPFILPLGYSPTDIVDAAILQDDMVLFFRNGTHHYTDLDDYRNFTVTAPNYEHGRYTVPRGFGTNNVAGMDFADSDGRLYTLFVTELSPQPARFTGTPTGRQPTETSTFASAANGITISKNGWTLSLPSGR